MVISHNTGKDAQTHILEKSTVLVRSVFKIQQSAISGSIAPTHADHVLHRAWPDE